MHREGRSQCQAAHFWSDETEFNFLTLMAIVVFGGNRGKACKPKNTIHLTLCVRLEFASHVYPCISTTHFLNCIGFVPVMLCLNQVMYSASGQDSWGVSFCASSRDADGRFSASAKDAKRPVVCQGRLSMCLATTLHVWI